MYISVAYIIVYVTILYYKNKPEVVSSVALYIHTYIYIYILDIQRKIQT
jgi:hypothetical protein